MGNDEKYSILNSSLVFKDFLSNKNITIKNLDDLVKHYIKSDQRGQVVINGGYYTWKIYSASRRLGDLEVWMIMNTAFEIWSTISRNRFIYSPESVRTDFNIGFVTYNHYTSAGYECTPFNDRVLGHAYYPDTHYAGEIHFNDVQVFQRWKGEVSYSLLHVAIHEIGHALGLRHNNRRTSIMFPQEVYNKHLYLNLNFFDRIDRSYFL